MKNRQNKITIPKTKHPQRRELQKQNAVESKRLSFKNTKPWGFPGGAVVENPPANAGDMGLSPGLGRSHMPWSN